VLTSWALSSVEPFGKPNIPLEHGTNMTKFVAKSMFMQVSAVLRFWNRTPHHGTNNENA
jgi:hypothetical protein